MSLLSLRGIGKIYVSEGNVAVGIRGVDLDFDKGEFVAVTGQSGSGKSTLLNVISGMDTYEEGELFINGEPTSHYMQKDWEEYRKEYISFIFQDYNILESFTVLQNVELALMNIDDTKKRREKALELIKRVGLEKHIHHKGSKLSGGQKQRTVIARALAKDSPVILADEPTGNLDSETSKEIISLLREVSRDKLVIVVTHNFEQVEEYATRHIRVFNGEIEADQTIGKPESVTEEVKTEEDEKKRFFTLKNGFILGKVRFAATPKLSLFMALLFTVTTIVMALITSESSDAKMLFEDEKVFRHTEGRAVVVRGDGEAITDDDVKKIKDAFGKEVVRIDDLYDATTEIRIYDPDEKDKYDDYRYYYYSDVLYYRCGFERMTSKTKVDAGRLPEKANEVALRVPISAKTYLEKHGFEETEVELFDGINYTVTGVKYYYDNTRDGTVIMTDEGFEVASAFGLTSDLGFSAYDMDLKPFYRWDIDKNGYYAADKYDVVFHVYVNSTMISGELKNGKRVNVLPEKIKQEYESLHGEYYMEGTIIVSPYLAADIMNNTVFPQIYTQMTVLFDSDGDVHDAEEKFREMGYRVVATDETRETELGEKILKIFVLGWLVVMWILGIVFAAMLLRLCSSHAMNSVKGDIAIMRSMGIPTGVIKTSIYVQNILALIPAFIVSAVIITVVYLIPSTNGIFTFMHFWDYFLIAVIVIAITLRLSRKYVDKMFGESVKKTLKGGGRV